MDALKKHVKIGADIYERDHLGNLMRPETVRPVIERSLARWEKPVRRARLGEGGVVGGDWLYD
jgi:hypothetical protein